MRLLTVMRAQFSVHVSEILRTNRRHEPEPFEKKKNVVNVCSVKIDFDFRKSQSKPRHDTSPSLPFGGGYRTGASGVGRSSFSLETVNHRQSVCHGCWFLCLTWQSNF
mmetsp:Transcript_25504/g.60332  ORF Transcript_25504/g.60332 Transcript_25504/m.60332 type:complete len:108 (-) Transcript_25504:553-876(-)